MASGVGERACCSGHGLRDLRQLGHEVAVAIDVVNARHGGPELGLLDPVRGECGHLAAVGLVPGVPHDHGRGVRRVDQRVVVRRPLALLHLADLLADGDQGVDKAVQLGLALALGGLDHERARHGPRHGGGVEAVVNHALGDVLHLNAYVLELARVEDELVRIGAVLSHEQAGVVLLQAGGHVVGVEDGQRGGLLQPLGAHHRDVRVRDGEDGRGAVRRGRHGAEGLQLARGLGVAVRGRHGVRGQEGRQVRLHADGAHAGAAAAVRDAERLVQVEMAHVGADVARRRQPHLRIHVGPVHVHLATGVVDDLADGVHALLVHAVRGGVGDHERGELVLVGIHLLLEVRHVDVARRVGAHGDDLHARHDGRRGVGAVRGDGDDAHVAVVVAVGLVVGADGHEARVLAGRARVGLQRHGVKAGDGAQLHGQVVKHLLVALRLVLGAEGVQLAELGPGDGDHLARGVELHRAAAQRDHRVHQRQVLVLQALEVAQHLVLRVVEVEDGLLQELGGARERAHAALHALRQRLGAEGRCRATVQHGEQHVQVRQLGGLVHSNGHRVGVNHPQVDALGIAGVQQGLRLAGAHADGDGVEEGRAGRLQAHLGGTCRKDAGHAVHAGGDLLEAAGSVVDGVHGGHVGQQRLRGADVGGGLVAADVLLARLHGHAQRGRAGRVHAHADHAARHQALVLLRCRQEGGVRAAVPHGHAKALRRADNDVGAPLAGGSQLGERQQVGGDDHLGAHRVRARHQRGVVVHRAVGGGVLHQGAAHVLAETGLHVLVVHDHRLQAEAIRTGGHDGDGLRVAATRDEELRLLAAGDGTAHGHALRRGGGLV
mmetsp:Transcript_46287/g.117179  ORF Transcript_46287/g.117179 Transcript_46287/m.117179 type:complete len:831 (+) Transcript_46287:42-2534(+)